MPVNLNRKDVFTRSIAGKRSAVRRNNICSINICFNKKKFNQQQALARKNSKGLKLDWRLADNSANAEAQKLTKDNTWPWRFYQSSLFLRRTRAPQERAAYLWLKLIGSERSAASGYISISGSIAIVRPCAMISHGRNSIFFIYSTETETENRRKKRSC